MTKSKLRPITNEEARRAATMIDEALRQQKPIPNGFKESTKYDMEIDGKIYPPKAILGIALDLVHQILAVERRPIDTSSTLTFLCFTNGYPKRHRNSHRFGECYLDPHATLKVTRRIQGIERRPRPSILDMSPFKRHCTKNWQPRIQRLMWRKNCCVGVEWIWLSIKAIRSHCMRLKRQIQHLPVSKGDGALLSYA